MINSAPKIKAILHPLRSRILIALHDRPLTPRQIALHMEEVPLGTVYRHLNILLEAGLVEVTRERRVHGTLERQFALVEAASMLNKADLDTVTAEEVLGLVTSLTGAVQATFGKYLRTASLPLEEGDISLVVKSLYLTPEEYSTFRQEVIALLGKDGRQPAPGYSRRMIGFFSAPDLEVTEPPDPAALPQAEQDRYRSVSPPKPSLLEFKKN